MPCTHATSHTDWLEKFKHLPKSEQAYEALIGEADEAIGTDMTQASKRI